MSSHNSNAQVLPLTIRQLAIGLLIIVVFCALIGGWLYHHYQQVSLSYKPLVVPRVIVRQYDSSAPDQIFESMSFVLPPAALLTK